MKIKISIITLITITTLTCKANLSAELEKALKEAKDAKQIALRVKTVRTDAEQKRQRKLIIAILKSKIIKAKYTLKIHKHDTWIEDNDIYEINAQGQAFHIAKNSDTGEVYASDRNKAARKQIYLALEHRRSVITNFGKILSKLAEGANTNVDHAPNEHDLQTEYNILIENILAEARKYAHNYFEIALIPLHDKQDKLNSLSLDDLQNLKDKFDELQKIRDTCKMYAETIYNDFQNDQDNIKDGDAANLRNYINKNNYKNKFKELIKKTEETAYQINQILNKIKIY